MERRRNAMTPDEYVANCLAAYKGSQAEQYINSRGNYDTSLIGYGIESNLFPPLYNRVIFPILHPWHGELVAISGRSIDGTGKKYWMTHGFPKKRMLFGKPRPYKLPYIVLVEGQLDVLALEYLNIPAYGVFGKSVLTHWQAGLLRRMTNTVVLWPDRDALDVAGESWKKFLTGLGFRVTMGFYLGEAGDPDEMCQMYKENIEYWRDNFK